MLYLLRSMRMNWRSAAQYRASFIMQNLAQLVMGAGELMAVLVLMDRFHGVGRWSAAEIMFFWLQASMLLP